MVAGKKKASGTNKQLTEGSIALPRFFPSGKLD